MKHSLESVGLIAKKANLHQFYFGWLSQNERLFFHSTSCSLKFWLHHTLALNLGHACALQPFFIWKYFSIISVGLSSLRNFRACSGYFFDRKDRNCDHINFLKMHVLLYELFVVIFAISLILLLTLFLFLLYTTVPFLMGLISMAKINLTTHRLNTFGLTNKTTS